MLNLPGNVVFSILLFWTVVLLYGLLRDRSIGSRVIRIAIIGVIWFTAPRGSWPSFVEYTEQLTKAYPAWLIVIAALLIPVYLYGFFRLWREKQY